MKKKGCAMDYIPVSTISIQNRKTSLDLGLWTLDLGLIRLSGRSSLLLISVLVLLAGIAGCGKKAMPSAPEASPVPAASDLSHEVDGGFVYLEWRVPMDITGGEAIVSRARTKLSDEMCDGCPLVFQQIAVLEIHPKRSALIQTYRESLSPGFRYTYRVVLKGERGRTSPPSNLVTFDY
jgi:predicted small lipoprotein YifL